MVIPVMATLLKVPVTTYEWTVSTGVRLDELLVVLVELIRTVYLRRRWMWLVSATGPLLFWQLVSA